MNWQSKRPRTDGKYRQQGTYSIRLHRLRAEKALGKPLPKGVEVHHADGTKNDDAPLVICQDKAYHALLHTRMRVKAYGGDPNKHRICSHCKNLREFHEMLKRKSYGHASGFHSICRSCHYKLHKERRRKARLDGRKVR